MVHDPGDFAHLVQAGAGVNHPDRPVENEGAQGRQGQRDAPHGDRQAVKVEQGIPAGGEDAVDGNGVDDAADDVYPHDRQHALQIAVGGVVQADDLQQQRGDAEHHRAGHYAAEEADADDPFAVELSALQVPGAQTVAHQNAAAAGQAVAHAADQLHDRGSDGIGRGRVLIDMAHEGAVGGEADAPEHGGPQHGQHAAVIVPGQQRIPVKNEAEFRPDIALPEGEAHGPEGFHQPGDDRGQRRAADAHFGGAEKAEDEHGVEADVAEHRGGADGRRVHRVLADFQQRQVALGEPCEQIAPGGETEITVSDADQLRVIGKDAHELRGKKLAAHEKQDGNGTAQTQRDAEKPAHGDPVLLSPVLGAQRNHGGDEGGKEHVLDKLEFGGQRDRGHGILLQHTQHQRVRHAHRGEHQALGRDGQRKLHQVPEKNAVREHMVPHGEAPFKKENGKRGDYARFRFRISP